MFFPLSFVNFLNSASSAAALVQSPEYILKFLQKTQYLMNTLYLSYRKYMRIKYKTFYGRNERVQSGCSLYKALIMRDSALDFLLQAVSYMACVKV